MVKSGEEPSASTISSLKAFWKEAEKISQRKVARKF